MRFRINPPRRAISTIPTRGVTACDACRSSLVGTTAKLPPCGGASMVAVNAVPTRLMPLSGTACMNNPSPNGPASNRCGALKATPSAPSTKISRTSGIGPANRRNRPCLPWSSCVIAAAAICRPGPLALTPSALASRGTIAAYWAMACACCVGAASPAGIASDSCPCIGTQISLHTSASSPADIITGAPRAKPDSCTGRITLFSYPKLSKPNTSNRVGMGQLNDVCMPAVPASSGNKLGGRPASPGVRQYTFHPGASVNSRPSGNVSRSPVAATADTSRASPIAGSPIQSDCRACPVVVPAPASSTNSANITLKPYATALIPRATACRGHAKTARNIPQLSELALFWTDIILLPHRLSKAFGPLPK